MNTNQMVGKKYFKNTVALLDTSWRLELVGWGVFDISLLV
jgi:hypothetical protein